MSSTSPGPGWWQASDGHWYPPEAQPAETSPRLPPPPEGNGGSGTPGKSHRTPPSVRNSLLVVAALLVLAVVAIAIAHGVTGKTLPMSIANGSEGGVVLGSCEVNSSGSQATASGQFTSPIQPARNIYGQTSSSFGHQMTLDLISSSGSQIGTGAANVPNGATSWTVSASNQEPGVKPTGCLVNLKATEDFSSPAPNNAAPSTTSAAAAPSPSPSSTTSSLPLFIAGTWTGTQPTSINFGAGCCNVVDHLTWSAWTTTQAVGHGTYEYDSCTAGCVAGPFIPYPATITLSNPSNGIFTVLTESTPGPQEGSGTWTYPSQWPFGAS